MADRDRDSIRLLLLGAPASGKGTQGERLAERYDARHVSTGELLREQVEAGTDLGQQARPYMERGDLVPDELVLSMVLEDVLGEDSPPSYVLDGFPRTLPQAKAAYERAVETGRTVDAVIFLDVPHDELVSRIMKRGRADDTEQTARRRIEQYEQKTMPLLEYYEGRGLLVRVDAVGGMDEVTERIHAALQAVVTHP